MGSTGDGAFPAWLQFPRLCLSSETLGRSPTSLVTQILIHSKTRPLRCGRFHARSSFAHSLLGGDIGFVRRGVFDRSDAVARVVRGDAIERFPGPRFDGCRRLGCTCGSRLAWSSGARCTKIASESGQIWASSGRPNNSLEATAASSGVFDTWFRLGMSIFQRGCSVRGCASAPRR